MRAVQELERGIVDSGVASGDIHIDYKIKDLKAILGGFEDGKAYLSLNDPRFRDNFLMLAHMGCLGESFCCGDLGGIRLNEKAREMYERMKAEGAYDLPRGEVDMLGYGRR